MLKLYLKIIDIIISIVNTIMVLILCVCRFPSLFIRYPNNRGSRLHIIGNGPSFKTDYERFLNDKSENDKVICVNMFANTELYTILKPSIYVICDPAFFSVKKMDSVAAVYENIISKTDWPLIVYVPYNVKGGETFNLLKNNQNITIKFMLNIPLTGGVEKWNVLLYRLGLANPLYQNVLVASTYCGIRMKFDEIFLWGADHSWLEDAIVRNNKIYVEDNHHYGKGEIEESRYHNVAKYLTNFMRAFECYYALERYSKAKGIKIYNCSSISWINAFELKNN